MGEVHNASRRPTPLTPRLRRLLRLVLCGFVLMVWDSIWLLAGTVGEAITGRSGETLFGVWVFLLHVVLGLLLVVPVVVYGTAHLLRARHSPNRNARRVGYVLFGSALVVLLSGVVLLRIEGVPNPFESGESRDVVWWIHVLLPLVLVWLFVAHRMVGPRIRWRIGGRWGLSTAAVLLLAVLAHVVPPPGAADRAAGPPIGHAMSRVTGPHGTIPVSALTAIEDCVSCHPDVHSSWSHSAHRFSSFDNPVYAASVRTTRTLDAGNGGMSTFCAGCHDPVLLVSGGFDDPRLDDPANDPASIPGATAGVNCLVCHSITEVDPFGNGSWTMTEPVRYPFHDSEFAPLKWLNRQLIRSRPGFHRSSMHHPGVTDSALLCGTCHKAWVPEGLNDYRWLHGQDHYDSWRLSGVSGHGVASWRWPEHPTTDCNECHMTPVASEGLSARRRSPGEEPTVRDHLFAAGNTALPVLLDLPEREAVLAAHREILERSMRVDIVGLREDGRIDGAFLGPIRPTRPRLEPGRTYLLEVVSRNLGTGHAFTQGTVDSNEIWLDVTVRAGERLLGRSGAIDAEGVVDPWAYRLNAFVVDAEGRRVENRQPDRVFTSVYDHQVPPGAASVTHYRLAVPEDLEGPVRIEVAIRYRKFDRALMDATYGPVDGLEAVRSLPAVVVARDTVVLPTAADPEGADPSGHDGPEAWERLYDYGIGLFRLGPRGPLRQAEAIFRRVADLGRREGDFGLARVHLLQGRYEEAIADLERAGEAGSTVAPWGVTYLSAVADLDRGLLEPARERFRSLALEQARDYPSATARGFDFHGDDRLLLDLAATELRIARAGDREGLLRSLDLCDTVLHRNPQDFRGWWLRSQVLDTLRSLGATPGTTAPDPLLDGLPDDADPARAARLRHDRFRPDPQAAEHAVREARKRYPWADHAADPSAIYDLLPQGGPER